ncbi:MAG: Rho termination factor N-terminal domain-containing protein [Desulfuromonadales bacterium]
MDMSEIRSKAKEFGLTNVSRMKKGDLIRAIQRGEGNFDCYASAGRFDCPQTACCWRADCLSARPDGR